MIEVSRIDEKNKDDINIKNENFKLFGRLIPEYKNEEWSYSVEYFPENSITEMKFPDENYNFEKMKENSFFVGAYYEGNCVGLAIFQKSWNKYLYLYDLKVNSFYRDQGLGKKLIEEGKKIAKENNYLGIYTQGQDNNLGACLFYLNNGFKIGGFDNKVYFGTQQQEKADIIFYLDID